MATAVQRLRGTFLPLSFNSGLNVVGILVVLWALFATAQRVFEAGGTYFLQEMGFGLAEGAIFALVALGYTMVYGIIELINFAHGDVFTLGAFFSLALMPWLGLTTTSSGAGVILPLLGLFVVTMLFCALVNIAIERVAYRPLRHAPRLAPLITAIGMSSLLEGIMFIWRGPYTLYYPDLLPERQIALIGGASISAKAIFVIVIAILLMVGLTIFINRSTLGRAMRATAQDRDAALLMGININRTIAATFFIGAALAGAGGIIYGLYYNSVAAFDGFGLGLFAFTAAVLGGIGNLPGAVLGAILIGLIQQFNEGLSWHAPSSQWTQSIVFAILILILVFRPEGLLGERTPEGG